MPSCRCSCTAYGGACDCRFDGLTQGRTQGRAELRAELVTFFRDWAKDPVLAHADAADKLNEAADAVGRWP